ncbi:NAD(P)-binding protein [Thozetella sp. PMI_491]|nr:NAD(P)-binding protein [Thozetella sp. PMI_491]
MLLKSVLVLGPTGSVGLPLSKELIRRKSAFNRIAAFNNTARLADAEKLEIFAELEQAGMEIVKGSYEDVEAFRGFDVVIMALGNFANILQPKIIDTAIEAGVRHFYTSEFGADITVGNNWSQRYYRDKVLAREHLMKRAEDVHGLGWTYITIGRFTEWATIKYFGVDNAERSATIYGTDEGRQSLISVDDTCKFTIETLLEPFDESQPLNRQRTYRFHGESLSWKDIFAMLKRITGYDYQVTYRPVTEALEMSREADRLQDDQLAMNSSHRVVQGLEGTLLPKPYDNSRFPNIHVHGVEEVLEAAFHDPAKKKWYGI